MFCCYWLYVHATSRTNAWKLPWGEGGGVLDRRYVLNLMHGRSRMIIDPRIPTMPGRSMSGFHRPGRAKIGVNDMAPKLGPTVFPISVQLRKPEPGKLLGIQL